jgi:two-component system sensor histidine kinase/response regulator
MIEEIQMNRSDTPISGSGLDREVALSRVGGDLGLLQEIAALFLSDSDRMLREISNAVASRDAKALDRAAHTLKGCVSNFGAQRVYDAALALEQMGRRGDVTNVDPVFQQLEWEMHRLESDLRDLKNEG